ncbi:MAG: Zn-ribbon domain-containing OB-fold protein [Bacillota bacterium]
MEQAVPVKEGLFTWPDAEPRLIISKCKKCSTVAFPQTEYCPNCASEGMEITHLSRLGKLRNFSSVRNMPPECKGPVPYGVGIAEFPEGIRIIGLLTTAEIDKLQPGMDVELIVEKLYEEDGHDVVTYKFRPFEGE